LAESQNDELLAERALGFQPGLLTTGHVPTLCFFRNDSLKTHAARLLKDLRAVSFKVLAEEQAFALSSFQKLFQFLLSVDERKLGQILPIQMNEVEYIGDNR